MNNSALVLKPTSLKTKRLQLALVSGTIIAAGVVLFLFEPTSSQLYPSCPFRLLTGLFWNSKGFTSVTSRSFRDSNGF